MSAVDVCTARAGGGQARPGAALFPQRTPAERHRDLWADGTAVASVGASSGEPIDPQLAARAITSKDEAQIRAMDEELAKAMDDLDDLL